MKNYSKILIISIFLYIFSIANCFAEYNWKKIGSNIDGDVSFVDLTSIKKVGNNAFYFRLMDYIKPSDQGDLSSKVYFEVNCLARRETKGVVCSSFRQEASRQPWDSLGSQNGENVPFNVGANPRRCRHHHS